MFNAHIALDQPARYEIKVQGRLVDDQRQSGSLADWFQGEPEFHIQAAPYGESITCLVGTTADQAALHGLLAHIRDLGLPLLSVICLTAQANAAE